MGAEVGLPLWCEAVASGLLPALADAGLRVDVRVTLLVQTWLHQAAQHGQLPAEPAGAQAVLRALVCKSVVEQGVFDRVFGRWQQALQDQAGGGDADSPTVPEPEVEPQPLPQVVVDPLKEQWHQCKVGFIAVAACLAIWVVIEVCLNAGKLLWEHWPFFDAMTREDFILMVLAPGVALAAAVVWIWPWVKERWHQWKSWLIVAVRWLPSFLVSSAVMVVCLKESVFLWENWPSLDTMTSGGIILVGTVPSLAIAAAMAWIQPQLNERWYQWKARLISVVALSVFSGLVAFFFEAVFALSKKPPSVETIIVVTISSVVVIAPMVWVRLRLKKQWHPWEFWVIGVARWVAAFWVTLVIVAICLNAGIFLWDKWPWFEGVTYEDVIVVVVAPVVAIAAAMVWIRQRFWWCVAVVGVGVFVLFLHALWDGGLKDNLEYQIKNRIEDQKRQEFSSRLARDTVVNRNQVQVGAGVTSASGVQLPIALPVASAASANSVRLPASASASDVPNAGPPLLSMIVDPPARLWGQLPIVYLGLASLLWSLSYLWHRAQRQELARMATRQQLREQQVYAGELLRHVGQRRADVRHAARLLRKPHTLPSTQLDLPATVRASVRAAGRFTPVHRPRRVSRHLLVLIERSRHGDPLATLSHRLVQALAGEGVLVQMYEFERDIRWVSPWAPERSHSAESQVSRPLRRLPLTALEPLHAGCGLLLCGDGLGLIDPRTGQLCDWVARSLSAWPDRALLTPALPAQWGELEDALSGTPGGFLVVPALSQALPVVAQWFQGQWCDLPALAEAPRRPPSLLHGQPLRWLMSEAPPEAEQTELLRQLRAYLGPQAFLWLAAAAVYPQVSLALTEFLVPFLAPAGAEEADASTEAKDATARRHEVWLLALMALPWFRHGQMPDWLRLGLLRTLPPATLATLRTALHELLNATPTASAALDMGRVATEAAPQGRWLRWREAWRRRMREQQVVAGEPRHSPLRDVIYVGVLTGQVESLLRLAVGEGLGRQLQPEAGRLSWNPLRWVAAGVSLGWWPVGWLLSGWLPQRERAHER